MFARWLPIPEKPEVELITLVGIQAGLTFYIDKDSLDRNIPADILAFNANTNQWYIMDMNSYEAIEI